MMRSSALLAAAAVLAAAFHMAHATVSLEALGLDGLPSWDEGLPDVHLTSAPEPPRRYRPVVIMHGLGSAGNDSKMQHLAASVREKYPGAYAVALDVADGALSYVLSVPEQVELFAEAVRSDPNLKGGFNAVGSSQGGLVVRGYIERYNDPPVHTFVTLCSPHQGVGNCPAVVPEVICKLFELDPYLLPLSFTGYWKDVTRRWLYLEDSSYLADINNARDTKNATYRARMASLERLVLVMALNDTVVHPKESAQFGFWEWGKPGTLVPMRQSQDYREDWIGLRTLDQSGRIHTHQFEGGHVGFSNQFWNDVVLPYLNDTVGGA